MSRRVLMIAYYFPPLGGIGSLRAARFAEHLPEFGWQPTVLAPTAGTFHRDSDMEFAEESVIRSRSLELSRAGKRVLRFDAEATGASGGRARVRATLRSLAHRFLYRPDPQIGWYPGALRAGKSALRRERYDAIFSTSVPMTSHLIARRLHRISGVPWVAEFRDPWTAKDAPGDRTRADRLERSVANEASELVMTSLTWAEEHSGKWDRPVTPIIAGADQVSEFPPPSELVVTHLGSFHPEMQDLSAAWTAIRRLIDGSELPSVSIRFIGELPPLVRNQLDEHNLLDRTEVTGYIPHETALELLAQSSVLVGAGPRDGRESLEGLIPAKLLEYLSTDLPIIYLSHIPNDGAELLEHHPGTVVLEPNDVDGVADALMTVRGKRYPRDSETPSWRSRAAQLAALLDQAIKKDR